MKMSKKAKLLVAALLGLVCVLPLNIEQLTQHIPCLSVGMKIFLIISSCYYPMIAQKIREAILFSLKCSERYKKEVMANVSHAMHAEDSAVESSVELIYPFFRRWLE